MIFVYCQEYNVKPLLIFECLLLEEVLVIPTPDKEDVGVVLDDMTQGDVHVVGDTHIDDEKEAEPPVARETHVDADDEVEPHVDANTYVFAHEEVEPHVDADDEVEYVKNRMRKGKLKEDEMLEKVDIHNLPMEMLDEMTTYQNVDEKIF